jgi:hypothetical protein
MSTDTGLRGEPRDGFYVETGNMISGQGWIPPGLPLSQWFCRCVKSHTLLVATHSTVRQSEGSPDTAGAKFFRLYEFRQSA